MHLYHDKVCNEYYASALPVCIAQQRVRFFSKLHIQLGNLFQRCISTISISGPVVDMVAEHLSCLVTTF
jgi:hypothetical protein